tara:strand:+ start:470 stop:634 length:165 start_codon:yes stop_codon:yes gene_type:complete
MFKLTEDQRKQLLSYMWARPYGEVAQHIAMLVKLETIQEKKNDSGKKDVPKVSG